MSVQKIATIRRLALITSVTAVAMMIAGSAVRVSGGAVCPDWPLCYNSLLPFDNMRAITEVIHRALSALTAALIFAIAVWSRSWRMDAAIQRYALMASVLVVAQIIIGAFVTVLGRVPTIAAPHLIAGWACLGVVAALTATAVWPARAERQADTPATKRYRRSFTTLALVMFVLLVSGALVSGNNAALVCGPTFPACNGALLPGSDKYTFVQWLHRVMVFVVGGMLLMVLARSFGHGSQVARPLRVALVAITALYAAQGLAGWLMVALGRPAFLATTHSALSASLWMATVAAASLARHVDVDLLVPVREPKPLPAWQQTLNDYVALTKPKVISLLLFTTLAGMFLTSAGLPSWQLVLWTMIGGYLMAGGANAVNMAYDTDIDNIMGRTSQRPTVAGRISRRSAFVFGLALAVISFAIFVLLVNWLAAALAVVGFLYYTVIYTRWLKRSTWQNIVIGGGAGAIPPMIGWAAASGQLSLAAIILFVIVFYWTPPHFWALALMKRKDYANASVPMLPVIAGEAETTRQMLIYSLGMFAITLVLVPLQAMGMVYLIGAVVLGVWFLWLAWKVNKQHTPQAALRLYVYSLLYLFALFAVMVIDRIGARMA